MEADRAWRTIPNTDRLSIGCFPDPGRKHAGWLLSLTACRFVRNTMLDRLGTAARLAGAERLTRAFRSSRLGKAFILASPVDAVLAGDAAGSGGCVAAMFQGAEAAARSSGGAGMTACALPGAIRILQTARSTFRKIGPMTLRRRGGNPCSDGVSVRAVINQAD